MYTSSGKRLFDVSVAAGFLVTFFWLYFAIVIAYLISGERQIIFRQLRSGKNGASFVLFKFRTLNPDVSLPLEERTFWLGRVLRLLSLDEIPQFLNVLRGEMSVVGPRPLPLEYLPLYSRKQGRRLEVLPGITGMAQVNGRHAISWKTKFEYDLYYIQNLSFWLDLKILFKTVLMLLSLKKDTSLVEEKFKGDK